MKSLFFLILGALFGWLLWGVYTDDYSVDVFSLILIGLILIGLILGFLTGSVIRKGRWTKFDNSNL